MKHEITSREWVQLIDRTLAPDRQQEVQAHLDVCESCRQLQLRLQTWESTWNDAVAAFRDQNTVSDQRVQILAEQTLMKIHAEGIVARASHRHWTQAECLEVLVRLLGPIYGATLVERSIQRAALDSSVILKGDVQHGEWESFRANLGDRLTELCGKTASGLARVLLEWGPVSESV
jgi:hypothetical protein